MLGATREEVNAFINIALGFAPPGPGRPPMVANLLIIDQHLTFESEAHLEVAEARGELEIIYPPRSIRVDPPVAVVDVNADKKGTRHAAEAYLGFLYSPEGRAIIAKHHYRPWGENPPTPGVGEAWPAITAFDISFVGGWEAAMKTFFAEGGVFDAIYQPGGA